jgi:hypothetical protein
MLLASALLASNLFYGSILLFLANSLPFRYFVRHWNPRSGSRAAQELRNFREEQNGICLALSVGRAGVCSQMCSQAVPKSRRFVEKMVSAVGIEPTTY